MEPDSCLPRVREFAANGGRVPAEGVSEVRDTLSVIPAKAGISLPLRQRRARELGQSGKVGFQLSLE